MVIADTRDAPAALTVLISSNRERGEAPVLIVTERDVLDWARDGKQVVQVTDEVRLTPLAAEAAARLGLEILSCPAAPPTPREPLRQRQQSLRRMLLGGERAVGTFIQTPHPVVSEFVGRLGFDLMCLDAEHSAMTSAQIQSMIQAADVTGARVLVRVAGNDPILIGSALDAGASGVIVPRVNSGDEAATAVQASRYPPAGQRGLGPGRAARYGRDVSVCRTAANDELLVAVQVESRSAVENLDEITSTDGLDLVFVGPVDLASSYGREPGDEEIARLVEAILGRCQLAGRLTGVFAGTLDLTRHWMERQVNLILSASDLMFIELGAAAILDDLGRTRRKGTVYA